MPQPPAAVYFGGTFDPPHLGHLAVIQQLRRLTGLELLVVPVGVPGHRHPPEAPAAARLEMVEIAVASLDDPLVSVCRREVDQMDPSFTVDTVEWLRGRRPGIEVSLALGSDAALGLAAWKDAPQLLRVVRLLLFERPGSWATAAAVLAQLARDRLPLAGAELVEIVAPAVDASTVRARLARGEDCADWLPEGVSRYILEQSLYRTQADRDLPRGAG
ncbi:MAG: nicotinate (nicotinamide) nucleotide adenylyltransferase [Candidatus Dormibacteria bacterium]